MAATYEPIATTTLGSAQSSYTFSSIPQTYTDLILIVSATNSIAGQSDFFQVGNGSVDTGSNYSYTGTAGDGSTASSYRATNGIRCYAGYMQTSSIYSSIINFQNYSNTTIYKTILVRKGQSDSYVESIVNLWRSTSAINTIKIFPDSNNFASGSTFTLYGIKAA